MKLLQTSRALGLDEMLKCLSNRSGGGDSQTGPPSSAALPKKRKQPDRSQSRSERSSGGQHGPAGTGGTTSVGAEYVASCEGRVRAPRPAPERVRRLALLLSRANRAPPSLSERWRRRKRMDPARIRRRATQGRHHRPFSSRCGARGTRGPRAGASSRKWSSSPWRTGPECRCPRIASELTRLNVPHRGGVFHRLVMDRLPNDRVERCDLYRYTASLNQGSHPAPQGRNPPLRHQAVRRGLGCSHEDCGPR
jgi:hypothetical protein